MFTRARDFACVVAWAWASTAAALTAPPSPRAPPPSSDVAIPPALDALLRTHCLDCHTGPRSKAKLDLAQRVQAMNASPSLLTLLRTRLVREDMPPASADERPSPAEYAAAIDAIDILVAPERREVPVVMRLNRWQYANSVRDAIGLFGVDESPVDAGANPDAAAKASAAARSFAESLRAVALAVLPPDDVGEGFDTTGDTLALPPLLMDKYLTVAEAVSLAAIPPAASDTRRTINGPELARAGKGQVIDSTAWLFTVGELGATIRLPRSGTYKVRASLEQMKAGPEDARAEIRVNGKSVKAVTVSSPRGKPEVFEWTGDLATGEQRIAVAFLNDYYNPSDQIGRASCRERV